MSKLPTPVTTPDEYSYAIVTELRTLNAKLDAILQAAGVQQGEPAQEPETVELREPEPKHRDAKRGPGRPRKAKQ